MTATQYAAALVSAGAGILTTGGAAFVVAFLVQLSKGLLNKIPGVTPGTSGQNQAVRGYVFLVSLVVVMGDAALNYALTTRIDVANDISASITVALVAIASYHILTSDDLPMLPVAALQAEASAIARDQVAAAKAEPAPRPDRPLPPPGIPVENHPAAPATNTGITPPPLPNVVTPTTS